MIGQDLEDREKRDNIRGWSTPIIRRPILFAPPRRQSVIHRTRLLQLGEKEQDRGVYSISDVGASSSTFHMTSIDSKSSKVLYLTSEDMGLSVSKSPVVVKPHHQIMVRILV